MKLKKYDYKCVRILDIFGNEYEGNCVYNDREYNYHEFGRDEECLQILNYLFFEDIIKKVTILENGFTDDYGLLEKEIISEDIDWIIDATDYEDNEHVCRIIRCLKASRKKNKKEMLSKIKEHLKYNDDEEVLKELNSIN